jgi:hypothetical protein
VPEATTSTTSLPSAAVLPFGFEVRDPGAPEDRVCMDTDIETWVSVIARTSYFGVS